MRCARNGTSSDTSRKRDRCSAPTNTGSRCSASASTIMVSCAPGANATTASATGTDISVVSTSTDSVAMVIATVNEPTAAPRKRSSVSGEVLAKREPVTAPMPITAAHRHPPRQRRRTISRRRAGSRTPASPRTSGRRAAAAARPPAPTAVDTTTRIASSISDCGWRAAEPRHDAAGRREPEQRQPRRNADASAPPPAWSARWRWRACRPCIPPTAP